MVAELFELAEEDAFGPLWTDGVEADEQGGATQCEREGQ